MKSDWIWMPHAGHFICGRRCRFKLNTYVNGYIVSTVGELQIEDDKFIDVGLDRKYETMVFKAKKSTSGCCKYEQINGINVDFKGYNSPKDAYVGHVKMCNKYDRLRKG